MGKGQELYKRAKQIIPGGTMLLSKDRNNSYLRIGLHTIVVPKDVEFGILTERNILIVQ